MSDRVFGKREEKGKKEGRKTARKGEEAKCGGHQGKGAGVAEKEFSWLLL